MHLHAVLSLGALCFTSCTYAFPAPLVDLARIGSSPDLLIKRQRGVQTYPVSSSTRPSSASTRATSTTSKVSTTTAKPSTSTRASSTTRATTQPTSVPSTTRTTSAVILAASPTAGSVQQLALSAHNSFRGEHGANPLVWNTTLAAAAQTWANRCVFQHSQGAVGPWGENLAAMTGSNTITQGIKMWTDESVDYTPATPNYSHFTQVVWKATTQLGCAVASCSGIFPASYGPANYYVCEYNPPGNVYPASNFDNNVQP